VPGRFLKPKGGRHLAGPGNAKGGLHHMQSHCIDCDVVGGGVTIKGSVGCARAGVG
jgi:hypothetical protein